jgi:hypothetical protein
MSTVGNWRGPNIVKDGLVLYLDPASPNSFFNKSGTTIKDISGNNYAGSLVNGPTYNSSNGGSIAFDGTNDTINLGNILNVGLNSWTMSCWVKFNTGTGTFGIIGKTSLRSYLGRYTFFVDSNNINALFQASSGDLITTSITPYLDGNFHNLSMTINRTGFFTLYVDGVSKGTPVNISSTSNVNLNTSTDYLFIGSYADITGQTPSLFLNGNISQSLIYNRALSASEVLQNYNATKSRFGL